MLVLPSVQRPLVHKAVAGGRAGWQRTSCCSALAQRLGPGCVGRLGWWQEPALLLSSMPGSLRARGLAAFPENTVLCLPGLSLSPGPALSHDRIRSE